MNEDPFYGFPTQGDEYQQMWGAAESSIWRMPETVRNSEAGDLTSTTQKRVRFEETHYSSPSGSEDEDPNDAFPDLFTPADDPSVSQSLSHDIYHGFVFPERDYGDNESFYDFEDEDEKLAFEIDEQSDSSENSADYNCTFWRTSHSMMMLTCTQKPLTIQMTLLTKRHRKSRLPSSKRGSWQYVGRLKAHQRHQYLRSALLPR
jgi:hypothetical protein